MKGIVLALLGWLVLCGLGTTLQTAPELHGSGEQRDRTDVLLDMFGELRTVLARYLWFKMDLFHEVLDDEGVENASQTEVMPLMRMVSLLDPSMVDAYDNIAWDLYRGHHQVEQSVAILREGLAKNKNNFQLNFRLALIFCKEKRMEEALESARVASRLATDEFDLLNSYRLYYYAAKNLGDIEGQRQSLQVLVRMRPHEIRWSRDFQSLGSP